MRRSLKDGVIELMYVDVLDREEYFIFTQAMGDRHQAA
jgi:hypothetical protein